jgi:ABC-type dipeptide/oligopeptide/nickel transport system permease subunit
MKKFIITAMTALLLLISVAPVLADETVPDQTADNSNAISADTLGISYPGTIGLGNRDIRDTIASIIRVALGLLGIVAVAIILMGGFTWMTAGGNDEKVEEAKKRIFQGVIGLAIILCSYALATFVINQLIAATNT